MRTMLVSLALAVTALVAACQTAGSPRIEGNSGPVNVYVHTGPQDRGGNTVVPNTRVGLPL